MVLIDHDLGGGVKDCFVTAHGRKIRDKFAAITEQHGIPLEDYTPEHAAWILQRALDEPPCPEQPDQIEDVNSYLALLRQRVALLNHSTTNNRATAARGDAAPTQTDTTTAHKIKVTLRGAKPPIWRRLEVPSTVTLETLHEIIQEAFGWLNCHMSKPDLSALPDRPLEVSSGGLRWHLGIPGAPRDPRRPDTRAARGDAWVARPRQGRRVRPSAIQQDGDRATPSEARQGARRTVVCRTRASGAETATLRRTVTNCR